MAGNNPDAKLENGHNGVGGRFIRATIVQTDSWTPRRDETGSHCRPRSSKRGSSRMVFFLSFFFLYLPYTDNTRERIYVWVRECTRVYVRACVSLHVGSTSRANVAF